MICIPASFRNSHKAGVFVVPDKLPPASRIARTRAAALPFQVSIACWIDLRGYGASIAAANFNPMHREAAPAIKRLRRFHEIVAAHSHRRFPTLVINDGAIAFRDLSLRSRNVGFDFLCRSWNLFKAVNAAEPHDDYRGARAIVAVGFRSRGRRRSRGFSSDHFSSIMERLASGALSQEQALFEAASVQPHFDIVPQLQANFAFTKAYLADETGGSSGLTGSNFYADNALFDPGCPPWIDAEGPISWEHEKLGLKAEFLRIKDLQLRHHPEGDPIEVRDGLHVAKALAPDSSVMDAIQKAERYKHGG